MIYKARVISNNDFSTTGKIKVRVFKETMPELWKPLTEIPDSIKEANTLVKDDSGSFYVRSSEAEAYVFSIISGLFSFSIGATIPREFGCGKEKNP